MGLLKKTNKNLNVWKTALINIRIIVSPNDYKKWGKKYLIEKFPLNNWNFKTLIHILPCVFGFSNMIWSRYQDQTIPSIFGENLPGMKNVTEETLWETFKFLKSESIHVDELKKMDLYTNGCVLEFQKVNQEKLIGIILSTQNKKQIKNFFPFFEYSLVIFDPNTPSNNLFLNFENIYYTLDELPKKVENFSVNFPKITEKTIFSNEVKKIQQIETILLKQKKVDKYKIIENLFLPKKWVSFTNKSLQPNIIKIIGRKKGLQSRNQTFVSKNELTKTEILKTELNFLFYLDGILINLTSANNFSTPLFSFNTHSSKETLDILNDLLNDQNFDLDKTIKLSGYSYPDLEKEKIFQLNLNLVIKNNKQNKTLNIQLPSTIPLSLKNNSIVKSNFSNLLPITYRKDTFFGTSSEQEKNSHLSSNFDNDLKNCIFEENGNRGNKTIEDFDDFDPDSWFLSFKPKNREKVINFEEKFFTNFIEKKSINNVFYLDNNLFKNKKLDYHFLPFSENFLIEKNPVFIKIGDIYKRTPIFTTSLNDKVMPLQKNSFTFFEIWEPISLYSWMLITQFYIGIFLVHLLKDLYKDYGKELVEYVLQFASSSGIDIEELKEQYLYDDPGYRLIRKVNTRFKDIAGVDKILLQLGEIVWFLRNNGRSFKLKNSIPTGILLTGPPGTGKTLLVQAIAGEAQIPIIIESGSLLTDPQQKGRGVERLKKIFDQARQISPCIIFIDEIDTLGEKRKNIIQSPMGSDELIESIYEKSKQEAEKGFIPKPLNLEEDTTGEKDLEYQLFRGESENSINIGNEQVQQKAEAKKTRLNLLTQFLVEMDGLKKRRGILVIGATNRPNVLDPALIRPGRFDQILNLELPGKQKRIEIFKLYGKKVQTDKKISWEYLANRTKGFSAADIATAMNESIIQSVINNTIHTVEIIEKGIDLVTSYSNDSNISELKIKLSDPFFLSRLAYYQAGKALIPLVLDNHPPVVVLHLWPRQKNARHVQLYEKFFSETTNKNKVEAQLIGMYTGKAAELLPLYGNKINKSLKRWQSDFGKEDLLSATFLANLLVDKWYFYSMQVLIRKNNKLLKNRNEKELYEFEKLTLSKKIDNQFEDELEIEKIAKLSRLGRNQQRAFGPWWQIQVAKQTGEIESVFVDWYRIYLPDPEEKILNLEWIPPDEHHHNNDSLKRLSEKSTISFNELYQIERDYIFHGLLLNSFNKAFNLIENKREFLDYFSDYLIKFEILRENEIQNIITNQKEKSEFFKKKFDSLQILEKFWGNKSRRKNSRFFKIKEINKATQTKKYQSPFFKFSNK